MRALSALAGIVGRSLEDPTQPLDGIGLSAVTEASQLWGGGAPYADPLRIGSALRCIQVLASSVAGCPIRVTNRETHDPVRIAALDRWEKTPTNFEIWETEVGHIAAAGNGYLRKIRARDGRIVDLVPILPRRVHVKVEDSSWVQEELGLPWVKIFVVDGGKAVLTSHDILHIPGYSWDGITGVSVIENLRRTWEQAAGAEQIGSELLDHGLIAPSVITTPEGITVTPEQDRVIKARFRALAGGARNAHEVLVLDRGTRIDQLTLSPKDAQFLESRKFSTTEIARIFGVPGWIINDQEKSTSWGSGMEQQFTAFVVLSLGPYFRRIEQRLAAELADPRTEKVEFKVEGLLRGDSKARAAFYASGIQHGWLVPNEPRALEDLPPVEWGDEPYRPFNEAAGTQSQTADDTADEEGKDDDDADA